MSDMNKKLIHTVLNRQFRENPDTLFIETSDKKFSGNEISKSVSEIKALLCEKVINPEEPIACLLAPSFEYVVSMLAIWEAGGVVFPLEKDLPDERIKNYLNQVRPSRLFVESSQSKRVAEILVWIYGSNSFEIRENVEQGIDYFSQVDLPKNHDKLSPKTPDPDDGNYILFTSGSTGEAKAIFGQHKSLSHFIHWEVKEFSLDHMDRISWFAPTMFDVSLRDILVPLLAGGTLVIPGENVKRNPRLLLEWLEEERITSTHMVPSLFRLLIEEIQAREIERPLPDLRRILLAGEVLYESDVFKWRNVAGDSAELVNLYGPSETTLAKLFHKVGTLSPGRNKTIPLGLPISNSAVLILKNGKLCPIGEEGEIYIKTPFRSKGYYKNQQLTDRHFVKNPLGEDPNDIIYKTGDLGYYREDRSIVFCGRVDFQLKIHGNRVEPTEIESVIKSYGDIEHAIVLGEQAEDFSIQLLAFYESASNVDADHLKGFIANRFPKYMNPDRLIKLDKMPFNRNGKIDRVALLEISKDVIKAGEEPESDFEKRLATIWSKLLNRQQLFRTSNFFESGGHSLLAIRLVSAVYREFEIEILINDVFKFSLLKDLALLLEKSDRQVAFTIPPAPEQASYPLSYGQRRLWTLDSMEMGGGVMTISSAIKISGELDIDKYFESWQKIVKRHEILRTRIVIENEEPRQIVHEEKFQAKFEDLSGDSEKSVEERVKSLSEKSIQLDDSWLFKLNVIKTGDSEYLVLLQAHHIVCDAWSLDILAAEQKKIYGALTDKSPVSLKELHFHYKDFSHWQRENSKSDHFEKSRAYWLTKLGGDLPILSIPPDFERPNLKTYNGGTVKVVFSETQNNNFNKICKRTGSTRFVIALALFKLILHRLSHQEEIVVGTTIANRTHPYLENQVGFYVQTLALRDALNDEMTFDEFVSRVNETTQEAFEHSEYPFDLLIDELGVDRNPSRHPVFDAALILHEESVEDMTIPGIEVEQVDISENSSTYDLFMTLRVVRDEVEIELNYNSDIYLPDSAESILSVLCHLINSMSEPSPVPIKEVLLMPDSDVPKVLGSCVGERVNLPDEPLIRLIEKNNTKFADKIAVNDGINEWSFEELHERANGISAKLIENGLRAGDIVALYMDRGANAIAAILGIWKAGGVYLPLNTNLPEKRIRIILEDSQAGFVVSDSELPIKTSAKIVFVADCDAKKSIPERDDNLDGRAYIIYTSGTTGTPKGVVIKQRGILNTVLDMVKFWEMSEGDNSLQFASLSFDASLAEILPALFTGATLFIPDSDTRQEPERFIKYVQDSKISVALLTPTYLNALGECDFSSLRLLISAGEAALVSDVERYQNQTRFCNAYGPSETSIHATTWFAEDGRRYGAVIPIGKPVANSEVLILDQNLQPMPHGFPGEICIAGSGVAEGYLNQLELTNRYFVKHPLFNDKIIYRTGDKGRINRYGEVEMLGRLDQQVKIRGHRIEPGEIEKVLETHDEIGRAHITTRKNGNQNDLIGYWSRAGKPSLWPSVAEFYVYDEVLYRAMYTDSSRNQKYLATFKKHLSGASVLEVGPGPELVLSRLALEAGAKHVYAVELLEETYLRAKKRIEELGLESGITLIHGDVTKVNLPTKVDYCISEIVGGIGGSEGAAFIINEVRKQLNNPSHMIPSRSRTLIAASDLKQDQLLKGFPEIASHYVERIFEEQGYSFDLRLCVKDFPVSSICSNNENFEDLDYSAEMKLEEDHDIQLIFNRNCNFTGFVVWLTLYTDDDHVIDTLKTPESWLPVWLPVSIEGIEVSKGDTLTGRISRTLCENGLNPDFTLDGILCRKNNVDVPVTLKSHHNRKQFKETPFYQELFADENIPVLKTVNEEKIKSFLIKQLPEYMTPSTLMEVEKFPLTASGKIDKRALPQPENLEETSELTHSAGSAEEKILAEVWQGVLGKSQISIKDNFFKVGGDSIKAIQMVSRLREHGFSIDMRNIFLYPVLEEMSLNLNPIQDMHTASNPFGLAELLPIQKWFFRTQRNCPEHFNQSVILEIDNSTEYEVLKNSLQVLYEHHPVLRSRMTIENNIRFTIPEAIETLQVLEVDLRNSKNGIEDIQKSADHMQRSFNLESGPLFKTAIFNLKEKRYILIIAHHLVVDGVSWRILLNDLDRIYRQQLEYSEMKELPTTFSFRDWSVLVSEFAESSSINDSEKKWKKILGQTGSEIENRKSVHKRKWLRKDFKNIDAELDANTTQLLLGEANETYHTEINDLLISALVMSHEETVSSNRVFIGMESTGREIPGKDIDLSETVGWFTSYYILPISKESFSDTANIIKSVKEQIRAIPDKGLSYGILSEQGEDEPLIPRIEPDILFNYFGDTSNISTMKTFKMLDWVAGAEISEKSEMTSGLNFSVVVKNHKLKANLSYHNEAIGAEVAEGLLKGFISKLLMIVSHTQSAREEFTPSDFTASDLDMDDLDSFLNDIELDE